MKLEKTLTEGSALTAFIATARNLDQFTRHFSKKSPNISRHVPSQGTIRARKTKISVSCRQLQPFRMKNFRRAGVITG